MRVAGKKTRRHIYVGLLLAALSLTARGEASQPLSAPGRGELDAQIKRLARARQALILLGDKAEWFATPFSCPVLKDFRPRLSSLGKGLRKVQEPQSILPTPERSAVERLEQAMRIEGKGPGSCAALGPAHRLLVKEIARLLLQRNAFYASYGSPARLAGPLFSDIRRSYNEILADPARRKEARLADRSMSGCRDATVAAAAALSELADAISQIDASLREATERLDRYDRSLPSVASCESGG